MKYSITFKMVELVDSTSEPNDCLFEDTDSLAKDIARLKAFYKGDWYFIGIRARAEIRVANGTHYAVESPGLWGIESDSGREYLNEVFEDQKRELLEDMKQFSIIAVDYAAREAVKKSEDKALNTKIAQSVKL